MTRKDSGWSSPQVIIAALTLFAATGTSYLAIRRDDNAQIQNQLNDYSRRLAIIETRLEYLRRERRDDERSP